MSPKAGHRMMKIFGTFDSDEILELLEDPTMLTLVCRHTAGTVSKETRQNKSSGARGGRS